LSIQLKVEYHVGKLPIIAQNTKVLGGSGGNVSYRRSRPPATPNKGKISRINPKHQGNYHQFHEKSKKAVGLVNLADI